MSESTVDYPLSAVESIEATRGPVGRLLGYGFITVNSAGGTRTQAFLVADPNGFRTAAAAWVDRHRHGHAGAPKEASTAVTTAQTPELESFAVGIPVLPNAVFYSIRQLLGGVCGVQYLVEAGQFVDEGAIVGAFKDPRLSTGPSIEVLAPCAGKIVYTGGSAGHSREWDPTRRWPAAGSAFMTVLFAIQPVKNASTTEAVSRSLSRVIARCRANAAVSSFGDSDVDRTVAQGLGWLGECAARVVAIEGGDRFEAHFEKAG